MKITVDDCLKLDAFSGSKILSCKDRTGRRVRSVSVLDEDNLDKGIIRNGISEQMVITHFWNSRNDISAQARAVKGLGKNGVAALVIYLNDDGVKKVDNKVIEAANKADLIIITINDSGNVAYSSLIEQVYDKILYGNNYSDNILNNTIYHLLNFDKHSSFNVALREAAINNDYQVVLMTNEFNPILTIETRNEVAISKAIETARLKEIPNTDMFVKQTVEKTVTYWGYINIEEQKYILLIVDNKDNYSATEMKKLAEIIELAIGMWKYTPERDSKAEFIKSAIRGDLTFCYSILEEAGLKNKSFRSVFCVKNIKSSKFYSIIESHKKKYGYNALTLNDDSDFYGMLYYEANNKSSKLSMSYHELFEELQKSAKDVKVYHVSGINMIDTAIDGFKLINKTWQNAEKVFKFKKIFTKYEMSMVCDCANTINDASGLKKIYNDLLEPFYREVSKNKGKALLETLALFILDANMNSTKTAKLMNIHSNTVQYRLKKINDILGVEITGNSIIPGLTMALAIRRLEDAN